MEAIQRHVVRGLFVSFGLSVLFSGALGAQPKKARTKQAPGGPATPSVPITSKRFKPSADGATVYDTLLNVTWLADANYAATQNYGISGINKSGSMSWDAALVWIRTLNQKNYLGHNTWSIAATPKADPTCRSFGPNENSFGFGCTHSALGSLYSALGFVEPRTMVPMPPNKYKGFKNFQPYLYWGDSLSKHKGTDHNLNTRGYVSFSFNAGYKGSNVDQNYLYALPMVKGHLSGNGDPGDLVWDAQAGVTWLADANLAASHQFGVQGINPDGAMTHTMAWAWIAAMNAYDNGKGKPKGWLGISKWQLPSTPDSDGTCSKKAASFGFNCTGGAMGKLFYGLLKNAPGEPVATPPDIRVGPFHNFQPYLYWSCQAATAKMVCSSTEAAPNFEFSYSFGNGFQGTDFLDNDLFVMIYFPDASADQPPKCAPQAKCIKPGPPSVP